MFWYSIQLRRIPGKRHVKTQQRISYPTISSVQQKGNNQAKASSGITVKKLKNHQMMSNGSILMTSISKLYTRLDWIQKLNKILNSYLLYLVMVSLAIAQDIQDISFNWHHKDLLFSQQIIWTGLPTTPNWQMGHLNHVTAKVRFQI